MELDVKSCVSPELSVTEYFAFCASVSALSSPLSWANFPLTTKELSVPVSFAVNCNVLLPSFDVTDALTPTFWRLISFAMSFSIWWFVFCTPFALTELTLIFVVPLFVTIDNSAFSVAFWLLVTACDTFCCAAANCCTETSKLSSFLSV